MKKINFPKMIYIERFIHICLFLGFICIMVVCIYEKKNLHCDEVYTYVLSNNTSQETITVAPDSYYIYEDPEVIWLNTMTVQEGQRFNFSNVWEQQAMDTHPPFYYALVHFVSSFFVNTYSKWFAGIINIIFATLTLFVMRKTVIKLTNSKFAIFFVMCCFIFSAGVLSASTFFRMYIVAMFFTTLISYTFITGIEKCDVKFYLTLFIASVLGALTHYYFIVFLVFSCIVFGVILLLRKQWKNLGIFTGTMILAGATAIMSFPTMLRHLFGNTNRGAETMNILAESSIDILWSKLKSSFSILNGQLFGNIFWWLIAIELVFVVMIFFKYKWKKDKKITTLLKNNVQSIQKWSVLCIPVFLYYVFISNIAVYLTDRYFHLIYGLLILIVVTTLCIVVEKMIPAKFAFVGLFIILIYSTFKEFDENWFYLYRGTQPFLDKAATYDNVDCLHVFNKIYEIDPSFYEARNYDRIVFVPYGDFESFDGLELNTQNGLIITVGNVCDFELLKSEINKIWPELDNYEKLGEHSFSSSYYFY